MKNKKLLWTLAAIFAVAAIIDIIDDYTPKLISSVAITLALIFFAAGIGKANQKQFYFAAYGLIFIALLAFGYRLLSWYELI